MLISEFIAKLEKIKEIEGDIEVVDGENSDAVLAPSWAIVLLKYIQRKLAADKITVLQSRNEMIHLIDCICDASITNKQAVDIKKLETNHNYN